METMNWSVFDRLTELARADLQQAVSARGALLDKWNLTLKDFGGDPSGQDWSRFRPLRLNREEDWSDWLAFLFESSTAGFAQRLLFQGEKLSSMGRCTVNREEKTHDGERRGDLIVRWESGVYAHIEVKVGDTGFEKTFETGEKLHGQHPDAAKWHNFLLVPTEDLDQWREIKDRREGDVPDEGEEVAELTWDDVVVALRRLLLTADEHLVWRAWAYAFVGNVEQVLLRHPQTGALAEKALSLPELERTARQTDVLKKGLGYEQ